MIIYSNILQKMLSTFQYFVSIIIIRLQRVPQHWGSLGRWIQGPSLLPDITQRKMMLGKTDLLTTLSTKVWNKISSHLKSRATVLLRMIRHATELYHGNYIRNKFTIWKKKKDYKKQFTKTAAVSQLRDMQRNVLHGSNWEQIWCGKGYMLLDCI